jgi:hypothetical protein
MFSQAQILKAGRIIARKRGHRGLIKGVSAQGISVSRTFGRITLEVRARGSGLHPTSVRAPDDEKTHHHRGGASQHRKPLFNPTD